MKPGRYWIDAAGAAGEAAVTAWINAHNGKELRVRVLEHDERVPASWYLFEVVSDVADPPIRATPAPPNVKSRADTVQRPDPESGFDFGIFSGATLAGFAPVLLLLGLYLTTSKGSK